MVFDPVIKNGTLSIRPVSFDDIDFLRNTRNKAIVQKHLTHEEITQESQEKWWREQYVLDRRSQKFVVRSNDEDIGEVSLVGINFENGYAEGGIVLDTPYWGNRNAENSLRLLGVYAFEVLELTRVLAKTDSQNFRAQHLFRRVGLDSVDAMDLGLPGLKPVEDGELAFHFPIKRYVPPSGVTKDIYFDHSDLDAFPKS